MALKAVMAQTFGTRELPPKELLPGPVADAVTAWRGACEDAGKARAALGQHKRVGMRQARQRDIEAHAAALEAGKAPPTPGTHEERAHQKLSDLERALAAAELVPERSYTPDSRPMTAFTS